MGAVVVVGGSILYVGKIINSSIEPSKRIADGLGTHNGPGDALRHCILNCRLTRKLGQTVARAASWYHENPNIPSAIRGGGRENVADNPERLMDEFNNVCGQKIGLGEPKDRSCVRGCEEALLNGELQTLDPSEWGHKDDRAHEFEAWRNEGPRSLYPTGTN